MLSVIMLTVVMVTVVMLSVMALCDKGKRFQNIDSRMAMSMSEIELHQHQQQQHHQQPSGPNVTKRFTIVIYECL